MASPPLSSSNLPPNPLLNEADADIDAEMSDAPQNTLAANASSSSQTLDNDRDQGLDLDNDRDADHQDQDNDLSNTTLNEPNAPPPTGSQPQHHQNNPNLPNSRKDVTLRQFLSKIDDYAPIIPDAVTAHYLTLAGLPPPSPHDPTGVRTGSTPLPLARLLALATQKFVADVAADAYQYSRIRAGNSAAAGGVGGGNALAMGAVAGTVPGQIAGVGPGVGGGSGGGSGVGKGQAATLGVQRAGFGGGGQGGSAQGKTVLTMEDLGMAVAEYGINVRRSEFYR